MDIYNNVLETIGNTPMIRLSNLFPDCPADILAKVETFNPGHSIKDRMALKMLEVAESEGKISEGGTIIECTSGNTGMGLAIAAAVKGYKCIFTTSDKQSQSKIDLLKAHGAEVIVCPTNVSADDPKSYYSVAEKLSKEIDNSFWFNQYDNLANRLAHYETTGPEIWDQTDGKVTHIIVGVGTGGTISGVAKYLKEKNSDIKIWGIDTYGSVFKKYHETGEFDEKEIYPYITEGIGEDIIPKNVDFDLIDRFEKVSDKDGAVFARKMARKEGLLMGYSAGSAVAGVEQLKDELTEDDVVVVIFHDHGSRYISKIYNDDWMRQRGFLEEKTMTIKDIIDLKADSEFTYLSPDDSLHHALEIMKSEDISQLPIIDSKGEIVGSITENKLLSCVLENKDIDEITLSSVMNEAFPVVDVNTPVSELKQYLDKKVQAIITKDNIGNNHIITQYDIIQVV